MRTLICADYSGLGSTWCPAPNFTTQATDEQELGLSRNDTQYAVVRNT